MIVLSATFARRSTPPHRVRAVDSLASERVRSRPRPVAAPLVDLDQHDSRVDDGEDHRDERGRNDNIDPVEVAPEDQGPSQRAQAPNRSAIPTPSAWNRRYSTGAAIAPRPEPRDRAATASPTARTSRPRIQRG